MSVCVGLVLIYSRALGIGGWTWSTGTSPGGGGKGLSSLRNWLQFMVLWRLCVMYDVCLSNVSLCVAFSTDHNRPLNGRCTIRNPPRVITHNPFFVSFNDAWTAQQQTKTKTKKDCRQTGRREIHITQRNADRRSSYSVQPRIRARVNHQEGSTAPTERTVGNVREGQWAPAMNEDRLDLQASVQRQAVIVYCLDLGGQRDPLGQCGSACMPLLPQVGR